MCTLLQDQGQVKTKTKESAQIDTGVEAGTTERPRQSGFNIEISSSTILAETAAQQQINHKLQTGEIYLQRRATDCKSV